MAATAVCSATRPFVPATKASQRPRGLMVTCSAVQQPEPQLARRSLLAGLALLAAAAPSQQSLAAVGRWDGESSAIGSCPLGEAGTECRQQILLQDKAGLASYEATADNAGKLSGSAYGIPVADMGDAYTKETVELTDKILAYASFADPTDPARFQTIKELKAEFPVWVSKYARGGSARKVSARKVYVVIDAISAHFAQNGLAPINRNKLAKLVADVNAARELLNEGR